MKTLLSLFALVLFAAPASAQQKVEIKPAQKKGLRFTRTTDISAEGKISRPVQGAGFKIEMPATYASQTRVAEEVVEVAAGVATKVKRSYLKKSIRVSAIAIKDEEPSKSPLTGRLVTITLKDGTCERTLSGGDADADLIANEPVLDPMTAALASGKVVKVGDTWTTDPALAKVWIETIFNGKPVKDVSLECKLEEIAAKDGEKSARISIKAKFKVELWFTGHPEADFEVDFAGNAWFGLTSGIATAMEAKGKMKGELELRTPGGSDGTVPLELPLELTSRFKPGEAELPSADAKATGK